MNPSTRGEDSWKTLKASIRGTLYRDRLTRRLYATDASMYQITPAAVVEPACEADVIEAVRHARRLGLPLAPRGSGSGLAGECLTHGLVLDFTRHMARPPAIDAHERTARVQAGCVLQSVNDRALSAGLMFGPDPSSANRATVGGVLANNATGAHWHLYGHAGQHVCWIEAILADGSHVRLGRHGEIDPLSPPGPLLEQIRREIPRLLQRWGDVLACSHVQTPRDRCGYNLRCLLPNGQVNWPRLLCGSEGTLAIFTAAQLSLVPRPNASVLVQLSFDSMAAMAKSIPAIVACDYSACELLDRRLMQAVREGYPQHADLLGEGEASLLISFEGTDRPALQAKARECLALSARLPGLAGTPTLIECPQRQAVAWTLRKKATPLLFRTRQSRQPIPIIEDVAVPPPAVADYLHGLYEIARQEQVDLAVFAHIAHGEPHVRPFLDLRDAGDRQRLVRLAQRVFELAWSLGGSIGGEHGCGLLRSGFLARQSGSAYELMRAIKRTFDPDGLLNPGKVITDAPASKLLLGHLRDDAHTDAAFVASLSGVAPAGRFIEDTRACNGCGACRGIDPAQTTCPVFKALGLEAASPRGKANLARHLAQASLTETGPSLSEMTTMLRYCIGCGMCAIECPSAVDVSRLIRALKARQASQAGLGVPGRVLASSESLCRLGSIFAPMANPLMQNALARWTLEKTLGLDRRRGMPRFRWGLSLKPFQKLLAERKPPAGPPTLRVVYFLDIFARYCEPALARAVVRILHRHNIEVAIPPQRSCALPAIGRGALAIARRTIAANLTRLEPYVRQGYRIVCSEPSAAMCIRRDWPELATNRLAADVAAATIDLGELLAELRRTGRLQTNLSPLPGQYQHLAYHAPCHLKAQQIGLPMLELLKMIPGLTIQHLDRGCCGIAGTFGWERDNYDLSLQIGRPAIDALADAEATVGVSECSTCRMQLAQATGKRLLHPVLLLAMAWGCGE